QAGQPVVDTGGQHISAVQVAYQVGVGNVVVLIAEPLVEAAGGLIVVGLARWKAPDRAIHMTAVRERERWPVPIDEHGTENVVDIVQSAVLGVGGECPGTVGSDRQLGPAAKRQR